MSTVEITSASERTIRETFARYSPADGPLPYTLPECVVHAYATADTDDGTQGMAGFFDSLLFRARIYDTKEMVWYDVTGRDQIEFECRRMQFRYFKDGSAMFILRNPVTLDYFQSMTIRDAQ